MKAPTIFRQLRRAEVIRISITELMLLVLFSLLAYIHFSKVDHENAVSNLQSELDRARASITQMAQQLGDLHKRVASLQEEKDRIQKLYDDLLGSLSEQLGFTLTPGQIPRIPKSGAQSASEIERLRKENDELRAQLAQLKDENQQLRDRLALVQKDNSDLQRKLGGGADKPRCFLSDLDATKYLLDVTIFDNGVAVKPSWAPASEKQALALAGVAQLLGLPKIGNDAFRAAGTEILKWSDSQNPKCRFWVRLDDQTGAAKDIYKQQSDMVGNVFYFYLIDKRSR